MIQTYVLAFCRDELDKHPKSIGQAGVLAMSKELGVVFNMSGTNQVATDACFDWTALMTIRLVYQASCEHCVVGWL